MNFSNVTERYHDYLDCLNRRDWDELHEFVADRISYNGTMVGYAHYRDMLIGNCEDIPDLKFDVGMLIVDGAQVGCRLLFDCTPEGTFMGLAVNGKRVRFAENVFYRFVAGRIDAVWSVVDKAAIEAQLKQ